MLPRNTPRSFLSTLSLRRATIHGRFVRSWTDISIHALLAESDLPVPANLLRGYHFYPRSPCGERRNVRPHIRRCYDISIHALLAESDTQFWSFPRVTIIFLSTLSLRRATAYFQPHALSVLFLSTLSLRRATIPAETMQTAALISIHALLAESDALLCRQ